MLGLDTHTDQIWTESDIHKVFDETTKLFKGLAKNKNIYSLLVDQVNDFQTYQLVVTDNVIKDFQYQALYPEFWGAYSYQPTYQNVLPSKLFSCLINRPCPIRQSWFYQLVRRNLLDQGWVSFMLELRQDLAPPDLNVKDKIQVYDWFLTQGCENFVEEHKLMRDRVPYRNFNKSIDNIMMDSRVNIVIETYFDNNQVIAFSEKIFRALQIPRPFFLFGAQGSVAALKDQGFEIYDDVVDHSYDKEPNSIRRQVKILNEVQHSVGKIPYDQKLLDNFEKSAQHNRNLLLQYKQKWPEKLQKTIDIINNISNNESLTLRA